MLRTSSRLGAKDLACGIMLEFDILSRASGGCWWDLLLVVGPETAD